MSMSLKELYMKGNCHIFTIALHELTGLQMAAFVEDRIIFVNSENKISSTSNEKEALKQNYNIRKIKEGLIHAFCLLDTNGEMIFDAKGIRHVDELNKEYYFDESTKVAFFSTSKEMLEFDISFGERNMAVETAIEEAKEYIETYLNEELQSIKK